MATLALILCRQVKTIKHGSVRINIVHFPIPCFLNFCSAVPITFFSFLMIFLLVYICILNNHILEKRLHNLPITLKLASTYKDSYKIKIELENKQEILVVQLIG